jgi:hypothetical protein
MYSGNNNYLSANTTDGSFQMTDAGVNISSQITDKFRVGAQVYMFDVGKLGDYHPEIDWAYGSYKFSDWFGIRAGKVKTTFGLFTDTQDMTFLSTFAMLPQAIYPIDRRDESLAHTGGDIFGTIPLKQAGSLSYTGFAGDSWDTHNGGFIYSLLASGSGINLTKFGGLEAGGDLRWNVPLNGMVVGASYMRQYFSGNGTCEGGACPFFNAGGNGPYWESARNDYNTQFYGEYVHGRFRFDAEHRRTVRDHTIFSGANMNAFDIRAFYVAGAYRLSKHFELGSYYSRGIAHMDSSDIPDNVTHILDKVVCLRYDITTAWNVKVEGHFMNGVGSKFLPWGFYPSVNPQGLVDQTPLLVVRTGWYF